MAGALCATVAPGPARPALAIPAGNLHQTQRCTLHRHSTHTGGATPRTIRINAPYAINPLPPRMTSSAGPPMLIAATVRSHVHSGNAATRGELVHRPAAQTRAALTSPLINPLTGNGTEP